MQGLRAARNDGMVRREQASPSMQRGRSLHLVRFTHVLLIAVNALLAGCNFEAPTVTSWRFASEDAVQVGEPVPGVAPFISFVTLSGPSMDRVASVHYTIRSKPGSASREVNVTYDASYIQRRGYQSASGDVVTVPIFALYAGYENLVVITLRFRDASTKTLVKAIPTKPYVDPTGVYANPVVLKPRAVGSELGFDYIYMKSHYGSPVVVDTDAEIRWVVPGPPSSASSTFVNDGFFVGGQESLGFHNVGLDGSITQGTLTSSSYTNFHHDVASGRVGQLIQLDATENGVLNLENILAEVDAKGQVLKEWDFGAIISQYMSDRGDDPSLFVRPGVDWFHMNSAIYDSRDDTIIVSSRESFVIKVDYDTGRIIWMFGDPGQYWYTFPSLRALALTLVGSGLYPVGQHGLAIANDGALMLFNNGAPNMNQPMGAPIPPTRTFSTVERYVIDDALRTADQTWVFDYDQSIMSAFCSSAYQVGDGSLLIDYATASGNTKARMVGLDPRDRIVFDFEYNSPFCRTAWNARPIAFEDLHVR